MDCVQIELVSTITYIVFFDYEWGLMVIDGDVNQLILLTSQDNNDNWHKNDNVYLFDDDDDYY